MTEQVVCQTASLPSTRVELGADAPAAVPSAHCRALIPADSVVYSAPAKRLVSASGPDCHRRMPLTASPWRRRSALRSGALGISAPSGRRPQRATGAAIGVGSMIRPLAATGERRPRSRRSIGTNVGIGQTLAAAGLAPVIVDCGAGTRELPATSAAGRSCCRVRARARARRWRTGRPPRVRSGTATPRMARQWSSRPAADVPGPRRVLATLGSLAAVAIAAAADTTGAPVERNRGVR